MSLAIVFPGQGSQSIGMMKAFYEEYESARNIFQQASEALEYDLWEIVSDGEADTLNKTEITQPAMLAAGVVAWNIWNEKQGGRPVFLAGHSLGEYTALVCAGAIQFADAVKLVSERGKLMQEAVPEGEGGMAAILGLDDESVIRACEQASQHEIVEAVNFNSPGQVVIAGQKTAVQRAIDVLKETGAKRALMLPVSVPSHCQLMVPAAGKLAERLETIEISVPAIPVIHNVDVKSHMDAGEIRQVLKQQLYNPVRWVETIRHMKTGGVDKIIECGPGKVLVGLCKRIDKDIKGLPVFDPESLSVAQGG
ncbi:MAG TPA: [acyl-carrier-protein] S-malonyltransferase [Gammaproteobacteria bacterium]|nr:[acyl-carrier-protein] S-malonyltransferase [Gammaproteobacteria bacterium]